jgi:hypothetical protein
MPVGEGEDWALYDSCRRFCVEVKLLLFLDYVWMASSHQNRAFSRGVYIESV